MSAPLLGQHLGDPAAVLSNAVGTGLCSCLGLSSPALCYSLPSRRFLFCPIRFLTDAWRCGCAAVSRASPDSVANGRPRRLVLLPAANVKPDALAPPDRVSWRIARATARAAQWQQQDRRRLAGRKGTITDSDRVKFASLPPATMILIRVAP